jgi:transcriptional regulator with XRE-family HTH domain
MSIKSPDPIDIEVGRKVREARVLRRMTQSELAEAAGGVTFQQLQKYENGTNRIAPSRLVKIAKALELPVSHFYPAGCDGESSLALTGDALKAGSIMGRIPEYRRPLALDVLKQFVVEA